ncbi:Wadjet anti-phage system protein JetD domain-containing protein [Thiolapillus sp.]
MKSPDDLARKLASQWRNPQWREKRLLSAAAWPLELPIGTPAANQIAETPADLLQHVQAWREVGVGEVVWGEKRYRNAAEAVALPLCWRIRKPSEWVQASGEPQIALEYSLLSRLVARIDPMFHTLLIRELPRLIRQSESEIFHAAQIAMQLRPGVAQGKPLRALSVAGSDSKFFERNRRLLTRMLDLRFAGEASEQGLEDFLGAVSEKDHWLLLLPLQPGLLPFAQLRVRASELAHIPLPAGNILVVENEQCQHQLPQLPGCIAVMGAGLNLNWLQAEWLRERRLAYWGDLDTWGLYMLGKARGFQPHMQALLMERSIFDQFEAAAVAEPVPYQDGEPQGLNREELQLFCYLQERERGRLEQEFLAADLVKEAICKWAS